MVKEIFYLNEQGKRENLEDSIYPAPGKASWHDRLFLVCDGVGGESKGEEASRIACESISSYFKKLDHEIVIEQQIKQAGVMAVASMKKYALLNPSAEKMSTTLTLAYLQPNGVWVAWCGDSRIYHISHGNIVWQSQDHSLVAELVASGEITAEEASKHPRRNVILRSLTVLDPEPKLETHFIPNVKEGDYILLCTDGILEQIDESVLETIFSPSQASKNKRNEIYNVCAGVTKDNFSMYLLELNASSGKALGLRYFRVVLLLLLIGVIIFMWLTIFQYEKTESSSTIEVDSTQNKSSVDNRAFDMLQNMQKSKQ